MSSLTSGLTLSGPVSRQPPAATRALQRPVGLSRGDDAAQHQRRTTREVVQAVDRSVVDVAAEHRANQLGGLVTGETGEVDAEKRPVLPRGRDGVGKVVIRPEDHDQPRRTGVGDLLHQKRRERVQLVSVVDDQDQVAILGQHAVGRGEHCRGLLRHVGRQQSTERTKWSSPARLGAEDEARRGLPHGVDRPNQLSRNGRLAHTGVADEYHAAVLGVGGERGGAPANHVVPRHDRPPRHVGRLPGAGILHPLTSRCDSTRAPI